MGFPMHRQTAELSDSSGAVGGASLERGAFVPVPIAEVPARALSGIAVYVRARRETGQAPVEVGPWDVDFTLYCAATVAFAGEHRQRLIENGTRFIYIRAADQSRFAARIEEHLPAI